MPGSRFQMANDLEELKLWAERAECRLLDLERSMKFLLEKLVPVAEALRDGTFVSQTPKEITSCPETTPEDQRSTESSET